MSNTISKRYYPKLTEIFNPNDLPESLSFLQPVLERLLTNLYYRNLQHSVNNNGDAAYYNLDVVTRKQIDLDVVAGIKLVLNPDVV